MKKFYLLFLILLFIPISVKATEKVNLYLFYSTSCSHCASEEKFLTQLEKKYDYLTVYKYEVSSSSSIEVLEKAFDELDFKTSSVPITIIGSQYFIGYSTTTGYQMEDMIKYYSSFAHKDPLGEVLGIVPAFVGEENPNEKTDDKMTLPLIGEIDPKLVSLPLVALVLGLVDGFNPCAMWVLIFLITILIGMNDRKKMWILGLVFLVTSAVVYLFFMLAWLNIALRAIEIRWLQILIATIAMIAGVINLKSYYKEKDGCKVVDSSKRKKIIEKINKFTSQKKIIFAVFGIMALAFTVNLIELACSAGLPLLFTQILALNDLTKIEYAINIGVYILFFLLDDLIVFTVAMFTLKISKLSTKYSKYSHLIGASIMILVAVLMVFKPEWLMFNFS